MLWRTSPPIVAALLATGLAAQTVEERLDRLEQENKELRESIGREIERLQFGDFVPALAGSQYGLGPAASKVYNQKEGLSIGGYGEFLYQQRSGAADRFDALRGVLYAGYRYNENWVVNTEMEFEHGTTDASSGTTSGGGSASLEFAYVDYIHSDEFVVRGGLLLVPMGFINEMHEPTTYLPASRPETEQRIMPSTWRENGAGILGRLGDVEYRAYGIASLDGEEFDASGLRGGRQKGNRSAADDFAFVGRLDWRGVEGLMVGGSLFYGDTGQDGVDGSGNPIPAMGTTIFEAHAEYQAYGLWLRALWSMALLDDTGRFNASTNPGAGNFLAKELEGYYAEAGYDVVRLLAPDSKQRLLPYVRYERIDTQKAMAGGFAPNPALDETVYTVGVHYRPIDQVVLKADFAAYDEAGDVFQVLLGYIF